MHKIGLTDIPWDGKGEDTLGVLKYIKGLASFIEKCDTPMSIALQGDWGTGKTSFINSIRNELDNNKKINTLYFNTWQYSQFNMSNNLYTSFINSISQLIGEEFRKTDKDESKLHVFNNNLLKLTKSVLYEAVRNYAKIDFEKIEGDYFESIREQMKAVQDLKDSFSKLVEMITKNNGRLVIFIDDLDRLSPEIAVELLEVIKLFLDVKNCVFVLAIDYDVVVSGVRKKFGQEMSEEKCKSFFDKIIQLPFRMPVETYKLNNMIRNALKESIVTNDKYINELSMFLINTLGANPRTFKRLANSFLLINEVQNIEENNIDYTDKNKTDREKKSVLLFISLIVQMYYFDFYNWLTACEDEQSLKKLLESEVLSESTNSREDFVKNNEIKQNIDGGLWARIETLLLYIPKMISVLKSDEDQSDYVYKIFLEALNLSSVTSIISNKDNSTKSVTFRTSKIEVNGVEKQVKNPTEAIVHTFDILLSNIDEIDDIIADSSILTKDEDKNTGVFNPKKELPSLKGVFIGTKTGTPLKMQSVDKLCKNLGLSSSTVIWYDSDQIIYENSGC